jgi:hypothetical protein
MEYNEDKILTDYIWSYGYQYMTELEIFGQKAVYAKFKAENSSPAMAEILLEKWGCQNNPEVQEALSRGIEEFKVAVRNRILRDHPELVKRCPYCEKILRTPKAQQCRWCLKSWHSQQISSPR